MRLSKAAGSLLPVAAFCAYLLATSIENAAPKSGRDGTVLLSAAQPAAVAAPRQPAALAWREAEASLLPEARAVTEPTAPAPTAPPPVAAAEPAVAVASPPAVTPEPKQAYRKVWAVVTAYCPCARCCGRSADGRTSIGLSAWKPGIAAEPRAVPYGTRIYVEGYGEAVVDDTGAAMRRVWRRKGQIQLDLRMTYHWQAREWGRQEMFVRVYED